MIARPQSTLVREIFPPSVSVAEMNPLQADPKLLHSEEFLQVAGAVPKRQREYAAGRILAHRLFATLGIADSALLNGPDRASVWPAVIIGSISHCACWAAVAIGDRNNYDGLGCDVELDTPLEPELWDSVLVEAEIDMIRRSPETMRGRIAKLVFSVKESCYKAQYYKYRRSIDYTDMEITLVAGQCSFACKMRANESGERFDLDLYGRFRRRQGLIATAVVVEKTGKGQA